MYRWVVLFVIIGCAFGAAPDGDSVILRQSSEINPDGSYQWSYENDNGISAEERGSLNNEKEPAIEAQGQFSYTAPDGTPISLQYVATADGFQPQGSHLPVAPDVPAYILRALEWNAAHPQQEKRK